MRRALESALDPRGGDDGAVPEPVVVQRVDAVGEDHDLAPDDGPRAEGEVEEVLAVEADAEQRPLLHAVGREMQEVRVARGCTLLELAAAEEGERDADATGDVDVGAEPVAGLAALDVVRPEVDAQVGVRLDARPEYGREVEERRCLEVAGALEVVLVARREAELQACGRADAALHRRELVFAAQQDVADADRVALRPADAQRLGCRAEAAAGQRHRDDLTLDAHGEVGVDDGEQEVDVEVVEQAVGQAERADVAVDLETVAQAVGGGAQQVARGVELLDDDGILRLEPLDAAPVELVELDVLVADVDVELPAAERIGPLEEQRAEGLGRPLEDL